VDAPILKGLGTRPSNWQIGVTLQQEILPRVSLEVGYSRRWLQNFTVTDNLNVSPADFDQFNLVAPSDSRLPGGGGYTISGLYNVKPDKFSVPANNLRTYAPDYGTYSPLNPFCHVGPGITMRFTSAGSCVVPKIEVMVSGTFQSSPAEPLQANCDRLECDRRADARSSALRQRAINNLARHSANALHSIRDLDGFEVRLE
jgi:hypothetical protein